MSITPEQAKALREPFPPELIGKLPKPTKKDNPKGQCQVCGGWHGLPAVHLDYVGHAAATDRLLKVDPEWTWEPMATDEYGNPQFVSGMGSFDEPLGLWIKLTVAGVTRPGFGSGKSAKEAISDAIRNAAMRFGVALDLWAKEDLHAVDADPATDEQRIRFTELCGQLAERFPDQNWPNLMNKKAERDFGRGVTSLSFEQMATLLGQMADHAKGSGGDPDGTSPATVEPAAPDAPVAVNTTQSSTPGDAVVFSPPDTGSAGDTSGDGESGTEATGSPADNTPFKAPTSPRGSKRKAAA